MTQLLVSVRSTTEALAALAGGAHLIDVKEPSRGSLGRSDDTVIAAIVGALAGRRPVSAAAGELAEGAAPPVCAGLAFVKWGLAGLQERDWAGPLAAAADACRAGCRPVMVAYADWRRAQAPAVAEVLAFATARRCPLLIDTWLKDGSTLLDWLPQESLRAVRAACRANGLPIALAGSLGLPQFDALRSLAPDWFAVRGAACDGGRDGMIDPDRVRALVERLAPAPAAP